MSAVTLDSHDVLGKLSVVKNYLSVLLENTSLPDKDREYITRSFEANESLIALVKEKTATAQHA